MIGAAFLIVAGLSAFIVNALAAWKWRGCMIYVHWSVLIVWALKSLSIVAFYVAIFNALYYNKSILELAIVSRFVFGFIIIGNFFVGMGILLSRKNGGCKK